MPQFERTPELGTNSPETMERFGKAVARLQIDNAESPSRAACHFHPGRVVQKVIALALAFWLKFTQDL